MFKGSLREGTLIGGLYRLIIVYGVSEPLSSSLIRFIMERSSLNNLAGFSSCLISVNVCFSSSWSLVLLKDCSFEIKLLLVSLRMSCKRLFIVESRDREEVSLMLPASSIMN
jgi:hypothetical protein